MALIMYTVSGCRCAEEAREYFTQQDIDFIEYDVAAHKRYLTELLDYTSGSGEVPCFVEYGQYLGSGWGEPPKY